MIKGIEKKELIMRTNIIKVNQKDIDDNSIEYFTDDSLIPMKRPSLTKEQALDAGIYLGE